MEKLYSVDRIEGTVVVLVDDHRNTVDLPLSSLPDGVTEGTVLLFVDGVYRIQADVEEQRRRRAIELQNRLRRK